MSTGLKPGVNEMDVNSEGLIDTEVSNHQIAKLPSLVWEAIAKAI